MSWHPRTPPCKRMIEKAVEMRLADPPPKLAPPPVFLKPRQILARLGTNALRVHDQIKRDGWRQA